MSKTETMKADSTQPIAAPVRETKTNRGFDRIEFEDYDGRKCHLQKSSLATDDCIWLGCSEMGLKIFKPDYTGWHDISRDKLKELLNLPPNGEVVSNTTMHLTKDQVGELLPYLEEFYLNGDLIGEDEQGEIDETRDILASAVSAGQEIAALTQQVADLQQQVERLEAQLARRGAN
jgi:uncharacterized small protein (DUF1192 family)